MKYLNLLLTRSFKDDTSDQHLHWDGCGALQGKRGSPRARDFHTPSEPGEKHNQQRREHILGPAPDATQDGLSTIGPLN